MDPDPLTGRDAIRIGAHCPGDAGRYDPVILETKGPTDADPP